MPFYLELLSEIFNDARHRVVSATAELLVLFYYATLLLRSHIMHCTCLFISLSVCLSHASA